METILPDKAAELLFELFREKAWLMSVTPVRHDSADIELEAVCFLLALNDKSKDDWDGVSEAVKETVSLLLTDFLYKLMLPNSPFSHQKWEVRRSGSPLEIILEIVACEIRRSHPHLSLRH